MIIKRTRFLLLLFALILAGMGWVVGCGSTLPTEPSPIPPPPNLNEVTPDEPDVAGVDDTAVAQPPTNDEQPPSTDDAEEEDEQEAVTPIAEEAPTNTPEPTPTLAPTAVPHTDPPMQNVSSTGLPPTARDLVFIGDGALKLWTHHNRQLIDLYPGGTPPNGQSRETQFDQFVGDITHFDVSADGNRIVAARITHSETLTQTIEGTDDILTQNYYEHELLFLDVVSKETWVLAQNVTHLQTVQMAPNQQTVAFIGSGLDGVADPQIGADVQLNVYTVLTPDKGNLKQVADCVAFCHTILWHTNSELFFFADGAAMWLYNVSASSPERVLSNRLEAGVTAQVYAPISLASNGRYLLISETDPSGSSRAVYDIPTGQLVPIPNSFVSVQPEPFPTLVSWMPDTRLLVTRNVIQGQSWRATLLLYRLSLDEGVLVEEEATQPGFTAAAAGTTHLENGRFAYGLINPTNAEVSGLYLQTSFSEPTGKHSGMMPGYVAPLVVWSPAGDGGVFVQNNTPFYGDGGGPINMASLFGRFTKGFEWLPETAVDR